MTLPPFRQHPAKRGGATKKRRGCPILSVRVSGREKGGMKPISVSPHTGHAFAGAWLSPIRSYSGSVVTGICSAELKRVKNAKAAATAVSSTISSALKCTFSAANAASSTAWPDSCSRLA